MPVAAFGVDEEEEDPLLPDPALVEEEFVLLQLVVSCVVFETELLAVALLDRLLLQFVEPVWLVVSLQFVESVVVWLQLLVSVDV